MQDHQERDPDTLAESLAGEVIRFFNRRKGFDKWWDGVTPLVRKEIAASLAVDLAPTLPGKPTPVEVIKESPEKSVPNPRWVSVDYVWVDDNMIPLGLRPKVGRYGFDSTTGAVMTRCEIKIKDVEKWLRKTALAMATDMYVFPSDKNRFRDLAAVINWEGR
jgi:hypothetical protein